MLQDLSKFQILQILLPSKVIKKCSLLFTDSIAVKSKSVDGEEILKRPSLR